MLIDEHPAGTVCWVDLGTRDPDRTAAFYAGLFGWTVPDPDAGGYRICLLDGRPVAGLGPSSNSDRPYWTVNVLVDDIDAATRDVTAAGGRIVVGPEAAGDLGWSAVVTDPVGATVSLWQPGTAGGMGVRGAPGAYCGARLHSDRSDRAAEFYAAVFGWQVDEPSGAFRKDGDAVATLAGAAAGRSRWVVSFAVDDVPAATARAGELGAVPAGDLLVDPGGAEFGLGSGWAGRQAIRQA